MERALFRVGMAGAKAVVARVAGWEAARVGREEGANADQEKAAEGVGEASAAVWEGLAAWEATSRYTCSRWPVLATHLRR